MVIKLGMMSSLESNSVCQDKFQTRYVNEKSSNSVCHEICQTRYVMRKVQTRYVMKFVKLGMLIKFEQSFPLVSCHLEPYSMYDKANRLTHQL